MTEPNRQSEENEERIIEIEIERLRPFKEHPFQVKDDKEMFLLQESIPVKTPSDNFKWNQLGELYQWFTDTYAQLSLQELKDRLNENINSIYAMIDSLSDEELFKPHMRKWADEATKTAVWEVYKFIHVNTVAPFGTFRTKIRKWKKIAL